MKKIMCVLLIFSVMFSVFAAGIEEKKVEETPVQAAIKAAASMTWDELLAKAKQEIGSNELQILASTSRFDEASFTEKTGIKVKAVNLGPAEIFEKVAAEIGEGLYSADIISSVDSYNVNYAFENKWLENFIPDAIKGYISESEQTPLVLEYYNRLFMYNNNQGAIKDYIKNIWQFSEPEFKGFEIKNPLLETCTMNFLITLTKPENQIILADAYKDYYGKEWANSAEFKNISYEWVSKFLKNAVFNNSDGTIVKNLAKANPKAVGVAVFSKFRSGDSSCIGVSAFENTKGFSGFLFPLFIQVASTAKYPYSACLYIYYCLEEEGFMNIFGKDMGGYSTNKNVSISAKAVEAGDKELPFWKDRLVVEDMDYVASVYAETFTLFSQWCADKQ